MKGLLPYYAIIIFLLYTIHLQSKTIKIPQDYEKIQMGIDSASNGDTVLVYEGIYIEALTIEEKSIALLSLEGYGGTIIDGKSSDKVIECSRTNSIIDGFTIKNGTYGVYLDLSSDYYTTVRNNKK